jgi:hypothetical protein
MVIIGAPDHCEQVVLAYAAPACRVICRENANSLSRLCAVQTSFHSEFTFWLHRSRNCRNPRACFVCPKTGSTVHIRFPYSALPSSVFSRAAFAPFEKAPRLAGR